MCYAMILTNTSDRAVHVQQHLLGLRKQLVTDAVDGTTLRARGGLIAVTKQPRPKRTGCLWRQQYVRLHAYNVVHVDDGSEGRFR